MSAAQLDRLADDRMAGAEFLRREGKITWEEGCLSVPDYTADVERASHVTIRALDLDGKEIIEEAEGLRAVCLQHEFDHLDGVLFIAIFLFPISSLSSGYPSGVGHLAVWPGWRMALWPGSRGARTDRSG